MWYLLLCAKQYFNCFSHTNNYYYCCHHHPAFIDEEVGPERSSSMLKRAQLASSRATGLCRVVPARGCVWNCLHIASHTLRNPGNSFIHLIRMFRALL